MRASLLRLIGPVIALTFVSSSALAGLRIEDNAPVPTDCPPGSVGRAEGAFSWCEPTVCDTDTQCLGGQVCRPIALCVEVGRVNPDASPYATGADKNWTQRLTTSGKCIGTERKCPPNSTCTEKGRCVDRATADKMVAPVSSSAATANPAPKKSACGCHVLGAPAGGPSAAALALLGIAAALTRRRRRDA